MIILVMLILAKYWFRKDNNSGSIPNPDDWRELKKLLKFDNKYDKQVTELEEKTIVYEQSLRIQLGRTKRYNYGDWSRDSSK